jgi:hypothetical protein
MADRRLRRLHRRADKLEKAQARALVRTARKLRDQVDMVALEKGLADGSVLAALRATPSLADIRTAHRDSEKVQKRAFIAGARIGEGEVNE